MNPWAPIIIPGAIGAVVAGISHMVTLGRFEQRQDDHERRIESLENDQVPVSALQSLRELVEVKMGAMQDLFTVKLDGLHQRLDVMAERRGREPVDQDRRVS